MATEERTTEAPSLALVIDAARKFEQKDKGCTDGTPGNVRALHRGAADETIEDVIHVLSLFEAYAFLDDDRPLLDPHAVSRMASMLVEKLRRAQQHLREGGRP